MLSVITLTPLLPACGSCRHRLRAYALVKFNLHIFYRNIPVTADNILPWSSAYRLYFVNAVLHQYGMTPVETVIGSVTEIVFFRHRAHRQYAVNNAFRQRLRHTDRGIKPSRTVTEGPTPGKSIAQCVVTRIDPPFAVIP